MKKLLTLFLAAGLLFGCGSDDDATTRTPLSGRWNMTAHLQYTDVLPPPLNDGDVTWAINGNRLIVTNTVQDTHPYIMPSGTYAITVDDNYFTIETGEYDHYYSYTLTNNSLHLMEDGQDHNMADGDMISLEKN